MVHKIRNLGAKNLFWATTITIEAQHVQEPTRSLQANRIQVKGGYLAGLGPF